MSINHSIASYMKNKLDLDDDNEEIIVYSLELLFHAITNIAWVLIVSWIAGSFNESLTILMVTFLLKSFTGGAHCSSSLRCTVLSVLIIPSFGLFSIFLSNFTGFQLLVFSSILCFLFSFIVVFKLAPVDSPAKPITSINHRKKLRSLSFGILGLACLTQFILLNFYSQNLSSIIISINISVFWQALMLTKPGQTVVNSFDRFLFYILTRGGERDEKSTESRST